MDPRALQILFDTYWSAKGWKEPDPTPPADLAYAKRAGVMFDPVRLSHKEIVAKAVRAAGPIEREAVADAFVVSLSSRRLDLRSALGSYAVVQHLRPHRLVDSDGQCAMCGVYAGSFDEDLSVLNFERFKWGGVRHDQPLYAGLDLELFGALPSAVPSAEDIGLLRDLFDAIEAAPAKTTAAALQKCLAKTIASSKAERDAIVAILGFCGILGTRAHPGFMRRFVPWSARVLPDRHNVEMPYPACWWRRSDGVNQRAVSYWFGHLLKRSRTQIARR